MKTNIIKTAFTGLALIVSLSGIAAAGDCDTVGDQVKKAVAKTPSKVLVIVDETISKNESCACEIVKAAIEAADAKKTSKADLAKSLRVPKVEPRAFITARRVLLSKWKKKKRLISVQIQS